MIDMKTIGENIRRERKRQLLTIEKLAEMSGITENFLGKLERGESMPSLPTFDSIASALNVSMDSLKDGASDCAEYCYINSLMDIHQLTPEKKAAFIEFIGTNIKFFQ